MSAIYTPNTIDESAADNGSIVSMRREAVAESRDSLVTHDGNTDTPEILIPHVDGERVEDTKNIIGTMYGMMAGLIEQLTNANMRMEIEVKEMRIEVEKLKSEKMQIEKSNEQMQKKMLDLRATVITAMTREIESIRKDMEYIRQDTQKRAIDEVKAYIENLPTVETKFQEMMKEHRSALARSIRKTTRPSLDQDLMSNIIEEHIMPLHREIETLKARLADSASVSACE